MKALKQFLYILYIAKEGFKKLGQFINLVVTYTLLSIVYIVGVGSVALLAKLLGKRFFNSKPLKESHTYWLDINLGDESIEDYYRQF